MTATNTIRRDSAHPSLWTTCQAEASDWFDEAQLAEMRDYVRPLRRLRLVDSLISNIVVGVFILTGGGRWAIETLGLESAGWFLQLIGALFVLSLIGTVVSLAPSAWVALSYDKRHGLSNVTPKLFALDTIKGILIGTILEAVLVGAIFLAIRATDMWWLWGWAALLVLQAFLVFLYPVVIMPRFNKFEPMPEGPLRSRIDEIADMAGVEIEGVYTMDGSKRSRRGNAFVAGFGPTKRVVVFDTIADWPIEKIAQIVAHEIGHYRLNHTVISFPISALVTLGVFALAPLLYENETLLDWADATGPEDPAAGPLLLMVLGIGFSVLGIAMAFWSRYQERAADLEALELLGDPTTFMAMWPTMVTVNKSELEPSWWARLNASHPPVVQRMAFGWRWAEMNDVPATRPPKERLPDDVLLAAASSANKGAATAQPSSDATSSETDTAPSDA